MMATPKWQAATFYAPGSLVIPRDALPAGSGVLQNPGFETGTDSGWDVDIQSQTGTVQIGVFPKDPLGGAYAFRVDAGSGTATVEVMNQEHGAVAVGQQVSYRMLLRRSGAVTSSAKLFLRWFDAGDVEISTDESQVYNQPESTINGLVSAAAPAGAAYVRGGFIAIVSGDGDMRFDNATWDVSGPVTGLVYRAVQAETGRSAATEPNWPPILGQQVIDNEVIWEAVLASRITWRARPILKSGPVEPVWKIVQGEITEDNTIGWHIETRRVDDDKAPNSKIVVLDQNKAYAGDNDLVKFCAVNNLFDWSTPDNAGYLPFGNGKYGSNPVSALGLYRGRLMAFNSQGMQDWQIDPDPALNQRLNALPIGCEYHKSYSLAANDAMLLTGVGVRTLGLSAASQNLQGGDAGAPVDPLVKACMYRPGKAGLQPISIYIPSAGQYWLIFVGDETRPSGNPGDYLDLPMVPWDDISLVFVYAVSETGKVGAWQRYYFPFPISDVVVAENELGETVLAARTGDRILHIHERFMQDLMPLGAEYADPLPGDDIYARIQWAWLEMGGQIGQDKNVEAVDIVGTFNEVAPPAISMGWDENDQDAFTAPYTLPSDTVPGQPVAFELTAPTISVRLEYNGPGWKFTALNVYLQDRRLAK